MMLLKEHVGEDGMQSGQLAGKTAIITGGASGIGAATAKRFVEEGASVVLADIQAEKAEALSRDLGASAKWIGLDVTDPDDWAAAIDKALEFGPVTTIVNSAGISVPGSIEEIDLATFKATISVNLEGVFLGCKIGVAAMRDGKGGSIINVASTLGVKSGALFPAYSASKGGVRLLTRSVALHCTEQKYDIRVNTILPGAIHTEMVDAYIAAGEQSGQTRDQVIDGFASVHPMKRLGRPEEPANAIVFLASDNSSFTTGADIPIDGGYLA
ncbi:MAG: glucose 1-dehydrogenase [Pseudomonadota bacterium]